MLFATPAALPRSHEGHESIEIGSRQVDQYRRPTTLPAPGITPPVFLRGFVSFVLKLWTSSSCLVGLLDEDEGRPCDDRRACAHERDVDVLDLPFSRTSRGLQRALDDMPQSVDAPCRSAPTEGVARQL